MGEHRREERKEVRRRRREQRRFLYEERQAMKASLMTLAERMRDDLRVAALNDDVTLTTTLMARLGELDFEVNIEAPQLPEFALKQANPGFERTGDYRAERKLAVMESYRCVCPLCGQAKPNTRQWHVRRRKGLACCTMCWAKKRGHSPGRARQGEPPVNLQCPSCRLFRRRRRQWDLKLGICKTCAKQGANSGH